MEVVININKLKEDLCVHLNSLMQEKGYRARFETVEDGLEGPYYIKYIEEGSAPAGTRGQMVAIALNMMETGWAKRAGVEDGVWPIARSISEKGTKTWREGGNYFIDAAIDEFLNENLEKYIEIQ